MKVQSSSKTHSNISKKLKFIVKKGVLLFCAFLLFLSIAANAGVPTITSFSPTSGPVGTLVTISGTGLNNPIEITIGGVDVIIVSNTGTSLVAMVMPGAITGNVIIITPEGNFATGTNFIPLATVAPSVQQGNKLLGNGGLVQPFFGTSVSLSADGNSALIGGTSDNDGQGAAWVYIRSGGLWSQQGNKLVGSGASGVARQGRSVCLSADGNTAIVGGYDDNMGIGAAWVFSRVEGIWSQQGEKLVGTGGIGLFGFQGFSVSLSADGNTAIVGGYMDNNLRGAAWVYTRSGGVWSQQGSKLVGTGNVGSAYQGYSVSLSADGNTAIIGGYADNNRVGAAWVFVRNGIIWTQQGSKLVGIDNEGIAYQGFSVSLSADGNTAMVGGYGDNIRQGAAWVYTRNGGTWLQQGNKLVGTGNIGASWQGYSVSLTADGNNAIVGGYYDNNLQGAAWIFKRTENVWSQHGTKFTGYGNKGSARQGFSVNISSDGLTAILGGNNDNGGTGAAWVFTPPPIFTIINPGNWSNPDNWLNGQVPPNNIPSGTEIIINPGGNGEVILDIDVILQPGGKIIVMPGKKLTVMAGLTVPEMIFK